MGSVHSTHIGAQSHPSVLELDIVTEKETEAQRREVVFLTSHRMWKTRGWDPESWISLPHSYSSNSHHWGQNPPPSEDRNNTEVLIRVTRGSRGTDDHKAYKHSSWGGSARPWGPLAATLTRHAGRQLQVPLPVGSKEGQKQRGWAEGAGS